MLVTNCEDNISRLWCETVLPDDGLISLQQLDPQAAQVAIMFVKVTSFRVFIDIVRVSLTKDKSCPSVLK